MPGAFELMTRNLCFSLISGLLVFLSGQSLYGYQGNDLETLIRSSCLDCHDSSTDTGLNFEKLDRDFEHADAFQTWVKVFDRIDRGEMPPANEDRPKPEMLDSAMKALRGGLVAANLKRRGSAGRVPARRLTKRELGFALRDLFSIDKDCTETVPEEVDSGTFDTVGFNQRISAVHLESYLKSADAAIDEAIQLGPSRYVDFGEFADSNFAQLEPWHEKDINQGGNITRKLEDGKGVALFHDNDYLMVFTYQVSTPGTYRLTATLSAYQRKKPVTAKFIAKGPSGNARLLKYVDVPPNEPTPVSVLAFLNPGDRPYITFRNPQKFAVYGAGGAKNFKGVGLAIHAQRMVGPIHPSWPPPSTKLLLGDVIEPNGNFQDLKLTKAPAVEVKDVLTRIAPRLFRRNVFDEELAPFLKIATPALEDERGYLEAIKVGLRSMLTSPDFLMVSGKRKKPDLAELDDFALATRLSLFFWNSIPDEELLQLAKEGKLSQESILKSQVDRMLNDHKATRFFEDFVGQWLRLDHVNATTPDDGIFPEFDELLSDAIPKETQLFFQELVRENLSLNNVIDSDFTFLNRRLAEHYKIKGVTGQDFAKYELAEDSVRGGILTQAAILKTTANGTTTSPVTRGNFVLTNLLGTPPPPPPPNIGSIEPDTRGKTTIREILDAHRSMETCNQCHKEIDPPGFALESFNPIGGYRKFYRISGVEVKFGGFVSKTLPTKGRPVDASGITSAGESFDGIESYKRLLMKQKEQVARNFISKLVVYSTGAEIEFADRKFVEQILRATKEKDFPVREIIHQVVQSTLFRSN